MNLPKNYYSIEFKIKNTSISKDVNNWKKLKYNCENYYESEIANQWISFCDIPSNKNMKFIENNLVDCFKRKIKFRIRNIARIFGFGGDNLILFEIINSDKYWELHEIDDLIQAFVCLCEKYKLNEISLEYNISLIHKNNIYIIKKTM